MVIHEPLAGEVTSGIADISFFSNPQNSDDLAYLIKVVDVSGLVKTDGFQTTYRATSGVVNVTNDTESLATGDVITILGMSFV
jgi:hypothetical protein